MPWHNKVIVRDGNRNSNQVATIVNNREKNLASVYGDTSIM